MLNISNLIQDVIIPRTNESLEFVDELETCLKSFDFERVETSRFVLCYLSNLLVKEFRTNFGHKSCFIQSVASTQEALRLFINKVLNLSSIYNDSHVFKELSCLCFSIIGPIDFQAYHLPIDKIEKFNKCLDFNKKFTNLNDFNLNIQDERRLFILQNLPKYSNDHMIQFHYFLIEHLLQYLTCNK